jgi:hypothetical protein
MSTKFRPFCLPLLYSQCASFLQLSSNIMSAYVIAQYVVWKEMNILSCWFDQMGIDCGYI